MTTDLNNSGREIRLSNLTGIVEINGPAQDSESEGALNDSNQAQNGQNTVD